MNNESVWLLIKSIIYYLYLVVRAAKIKLIGNEYSAQFAKHRAFQTLMFIKQDILDIELSEDETNQLNS